MATARSKATLMAVALLAGGGSSAMASPASDRMVLAVDGIGQTRNLPILLAERLGYFKQQGLTVTLVDSPGEPSPAQLMADGRADGAVAFYHHTFMSQTDNHQLTQAVVLMGISPGLKLIVSNRLRGTVKTPGDLAGRRIVTGGTNSGKTTSADWIALHWDFGIGGFTRLPLADRATLAQQLRDGAIDAIVAHEPDAGFYASHGGYQLADLESRAGTQQALGSIYPSTSLYLPTAYIAGHEKEVARLVHACLKALAYIHDHDAAAIVKILPPKVVGKDRGAFIALLAQDKQMFDTDGLMPPDAARAEWMAMSALTPKYKSIRFDDTFTNRFVEAARRQASTDGEEK